jgi:DNA ligase (NAD+)
VAVSKDPEKRKDPKDPEKRIEELRNQIRRADRLYYNLGQPELTDSEYDALFVELRELEEAHPGLRTADSPTVRVGAPLPKGSGFEKVQHLVPMLSIESLQTEEDVQEFWERACKQLQLAEGDPLQWTVEPKFDGVSANLLYENGKLVRGLSRGDGTQGEDITRNLRTIRNLPLELTGDGPFPPRVEVRGEVILSISAFERLRRAAETTTETPFRNARNAVAGTLKLLDPRIAARREMEFICWGTGHVESLDVATYAELHQQLKGWGFKVADLFDVVDDVSGIVAFHHDLEERRDEIEYEMDGIVAKVDRLELQRRLGRTARSPRWMLALKFAPRRALTKVERILAQVGRTGAVTPVAELSPVELAGVTVKRATLHNWGLMQERDVREGDTVEIERAGDVIPEVVTVLKKKRGKKSSAFPTPKACPVCNSKLEPEGAFLYCVNVECPDQIKGRIVHMASRRALDIDRLGPKYVDQLLEVGLLQRPEDVFSLADKKDEILALSRWGEKSFQRLVDEVASAKHPELARFVYALGIRHVGEQTARDLADQIESLDEILEAPEEKLQQVEGIGPEVARSIVRFFEVAGNRRFVDAAKKAGLKIKVKERQQGPLAGRVFCFTGGLSSVTRDQAKALAEAQGANTSSSISKKVTDVVLGEAAGSKAEKAKKLELNMMDEAEFLALVGKG